MAITLEAIRAAGGIVHSDGNIFFRDISMLQGLAGATPAAVAPQGEYPQLPEGVMFIEQAGGDVIGRPTDYGFKHGRGIVHGAELFTSEQLRAYFDLGRQPSTAAPALEAPAAPAEAEKLDAAAMPAQLSAIAAQAALDAKERHSYLPNTSAEAATWRPHFWVIQAMRAAIKFDRAINGAAAPQAPAAPLCEDCDDTGTVYDGKRVSFCQTGCAASVAERRADAAAPAAPDDVLCYIRPGATLPERHGFEVCRATDAGAMAVIGNGRVAAPAEPASKRIGQILNPAPEHPQDTGSVVVAEIMSNGYNGQVLWKGTVPPVGTLLYAAPVAAPAAPAVDALDAARWRAATRDQNQVDAEVRIGGFVLMNDAADEAIDALIAAQAKEGGAA